MIDFQIIQPINQVIILQKDFMSAAAGSSTVSPLHFTSLTQFYPESAASNLPPFDPNRKESLSGCTWNELFQKAVTADVPCFVVSVTLWHEGRTIIWKLYDAVEFNHQAKELIERQKIKGLKFLGEKKFFLSCFVSLLSQQKENNLKSSNFTPSYMPLVLFPVPMHPQHVIIETANGNLQRTAILMAKNPKKLVKLEHLALQGCNYNLDKKLDGQGQLPDPVAGQTQLTVARELFKIAEDFSGEMKQKRLTKALRWAVHAQRNLASTSLCTVSQIQVSMILEHFYSASDGSSKEMQAKKEPEKAAPAASQAKKN
jgi:hypothetical protein